MRVRVHRVAAAAPNDTEGLNTLIETGRVCPERIVAVLGKTEGNGCVNDFTRGFAVAMLSSFLARATKRTEAEVLREVVLVMSGGTEGGLSPHWLVFEVVNDDRPPGSDGKALALGTGFTRPFAAHEIGRTPQIVETAGAVRKAMMDAGIESIDDVHYVQVKCPLLTKARIGDARDAGHAVATEDPLTSMAYSRGASALGVALALDEIPAGAIRNEAVCRDFALYSERASTSAGIELLENQVLVIGNSRHWSGDLVATHAVMQDAIDADATSRALRAIGMQGVLPLGPVEQRRVLAVLAKAEPSRTGNIRGSRHTMLEDSDIPSSRHARALVGGVLAGCLGTTMLFVSGGAEHQGPDGGGPLAIIARRPTEGRGASAD